ncbi:MAG: UvrD-helicase domain-containing protein [Synergistaceae bacterium]|nr:UvrD-helicase domain-containing protein [Synergistaceae bacterium]
MNFSLPAQTPEGQRNAVNADEKTITVGAGAGTGKTWVLTNRYLRLLLENENISPSNILTLTFTEAAAGEMKQRIEKRISEEIKNFNRQNRKQNIIEGLSDSWISTIHSFAGRIIRESGLSLDVDPRASVITTQQTEDFWEGIKNALEFANLRELARTYGDKILRDNAKILDEDDYLSSAVNKWKSGILTTLARDVSELHSSLGHSWIDMLKWSDDDETLINEAWPGVENILTNEWLDIWNLFAKMNLPNTSKTNSAGILLNSILDWQSQNSSDSKYSLKRFYDAVVLDKNIKANRFEPFATFKDIEGMSFGDWRKSRSETIKNITQDLDSNFRQKISPEEKRMRRSLMKFCALSWGMWDMMKQRRGLLSFSDMILHAKKAIENDSVTRTFNHILVDEFQDTDKLQFDMIKALINDKNDAKLFVVGDIKQSIYGFRHANPLLFAKLMKDDADINIDLDVSFRTRYSLLDKINKIFGALWRDGLGMSEKMKEQHYKNLDTPIKDSERDSGTMPDFKIIIAKNPGGSTAAARKILADNIAFNIAKFVNEGRTIWDKNLKIIRPVKFSDFSILSRSRGIYPVLEEAFDKFNIKTIVDKSTDYFTRGEINDVVCLLRAATNFDDDFSVTGWLMSPFSGVDEDEAVNKFLTLINDKNRPIDIIRENFADAYSRLEYFSVVGEVKGASGILEILDKDRKWLSGYKINDRLRILRNLRQAVSIAGAFQQSGVSSLNSCAEYLTRSIRNKIQIEEPEWHDENENAVKLGVVHSAKGLEYPVTVIFETRTSKKSENRSIKPSKDLGLVFNTLPDEIKTDSKIILSDWEKLLSEQGEIEEEERLFYVAATRAQDSLIFCGLTNKDDKPYPSTWTGFLLNNINLDENKIDYAVEIENSEINSLKYDDEKDTEKVLQPLNLTVHKNYLRQFSASSFSLFEFCPFAWRRKYKQGVELSWDNSEMNIDFNNGENENENFVGGAELGNLAHWILSKWPINENYESELEYYLNDREIISKLPGKLRKIWRNKNSKITLREWLLNFANGELGQKLIKLGKNIKREYHFRVKLNDISLAGAMDGFYENNIIDYKITPIDKAPSTIYDSQMDFYAFSAHELTGCESVNIVTVYLRDNKITKRVCNNFDEIKTRILKACETCATGFCEAKFENCNSCPFKRGCVKFGKNN